MSSLLWGEWSASSGAVREPHGEVGVLVCQHLHSAAFYLYESLTSASEFSLACGPRGFYFQCLPLVSPARFWAVPVDGNSSVSFRYLFPERLAVGRVVTVQRAPLFSFQATSWAVADLCVDALPSIEAPDHSGQVWPGWQCQNTKQNVVSSYIVRLFGHDRSSGSLLEDENSWVVHSSEGAHEDRSVIEREFTGALKDTAQQTSPAVVK